MESNKFLSEFLMITNIKTVLFILVLLSLFYLIRILEKKKIKFSNRMIFSIFLGFLLGGIIQWTVGFPSEPMNLQWIDEVSTWFGLFGNGFMDLLKMIIVPLVFFSIIKVIIEMKESDKLSKMAITSIFMLLLTTLLASIIGIFVGNLFNLGSVISGIASNASAREITSVVDTLRNLLPSNPFKAMVDGNIVAIVIFSGFIGLAMRRVKKKDKETIESIEKLVLGGYKIAVSITMSIIKFMPYAVVALLANTIAQRGLDAIVGVLDFILAIYVSIALMFLVHLIIVAINGVNPLRYLKSVMEPLVLAFTSRSSLGTLPMTIKALN